jgi:hypothetical protein
VPQEIDVRLQRRETAPLGAGVLLRVQAINRGKNPSRNLRFFVTTSGEVYTARHSDDTGDWQTPFDEPYPPAPDRRLSPERLQSLRAVLDSRFEGEAAYTADEGVEGGLFLVITARTRSGLHESMYEAALTAVAKEVLALAAGDGE